MITVLAYGRLFGALGSKVLDFFESLQKRLGESIIVPAVYAINREEFIDLLRSDACTYARVAIVRFNHFDSEWCEPRVYIQASAYTDAKRHVVYLVEPPIELAVDAPKYARRYAESQAITFGRFLRENGISVSINDESGSSLDLTTA